VILKEKHSYTPLVPVFCFYLTSALRFKILKTDIDSSRFLFLFISAYFFAYLSIKSSENFNNYYLHIRVNTLFSLIIIQYK